MSGRVVPRRVYLGIFAALIVLTALTVASSCVDLGFFNVFIAITIAVTKALLVLLFFMHVRYSDRLIWVVAGAGFFWLLIMLSLTLSDFLTRQW